jgi:hypothetical protein
MTISYLTDVSLLLALVSAVREKDLTRHMQAEREMLSLCFAFDHINYARYMSFQHVNLLMLEMCHDPAFTELSERGFGGSLSGEKFSAIHGDLITEIYNGETKGTAGPFRSGYSTDITTVNTWVKTSHIHARVRTEFKKNINLCTSAVHKESTASAKELHVRHVSKLKQKLEDYQIDPFGSGAARHITNGKELDHQVVTDMLRAPDIGSEKYKQFVEDRLVKQTVDFFQPIKKLKLRTGLSKQAKQPRKVSVLKEDRQAFGDLLSKSIDIEEAMQYPLTSVPLAIATPEGTLRPASKHLLRNFIIEQSEAAAHECPQNARWLIDWMAAMRSIKPKLTYREWLINLLRLVTPRDDLIPIDLEIINDTYYQESVKSCTRSVRGEESRRVHVQGFDQEMLKGNEWLAFFHNIENKTD